MEAPDTRGLDQLIGCIMIFALIGLAATVFGIHWIVTHTTITWR